MDRIKKLCTYLDKCESFADVGCDHGYCTEFMLKNGLCDFAVISDISAKCLQKAEKLLESYVKSGKVKSVCCNGLEAIDESCDQILIAGMGGEEIVSILQNSFIPRAFVFQPMKNAEKLRRYLCACGVQITVDEVFKSGGKFYFVIKGKNAGLPCTYTAAQLKFGKNLHSAETEEYINCELDKKRAYLKRNLSTHSRIDIEKEIEFAEGVLSGEIN